VPELAGRDVTALISDDDDVVERDGRDLRAGRSISV